MGISTTLSFLFGMAYQFLVKGSFWLSKEIIEIFYESDPFSACKWVSWKNLRKDHLQNSEMNPFSASQRIVFDNLQIDSFEYQLNGSIFRCIKDHSRAQTKDRF